MSTNMKKADKGKGHARSAFAPKLKGRRSTKPPPSVLALTKKRDAKKAGACAVEPGALERKEEEGEKRGGEEGGIPLTGPPKLPAMGNRESVLEHNGYYMRQRTLLTTDTLGENAFESDLHLSPVFESPKHASECIKKLYDGHETSPYTNEELMCMPDAVELAGDKVVILGTRAPVHIPARIVQKTEEAIIQTDVFGELVHAGGTTRLAGRQSLAMKIGKKGLDASVDDDHIRLFVNHMQVLGRISIVRQSQSHGFRNSNTMHELRRRVCDLTTLKCTQTGVVCTIKTAFDLSSKELVARITSPLGGILFLDGVPQPSLDGFGETVHTVVLTPRILERMVPTTFEDPNMMFMLNLGVVHQMTVFLPEFVANPNDESVLVGGEFLDFDNIMTHAELTCVASLLNVLCASTAGVLPELTHTHNPDPVPVSKAPEGKVVDVYRGKCPWRAKVLQEFRASKTAKVQNKKTGEISTVQFCHLRKKFGGLHAYQNRLAHFDEHSVEIVRSYGSELHIRMETAAIFSGALIEFVGTPLLQNFVMRVYDVSHHEDIQILNLKIREIEFDQSFTGKVKIYTVGMSLASVMKTDPHRHVHAMSLHIRHLPFYTT